MFTGLISEMGIIEFLTPRDSGLIIGIAASTIITSLKVGGSVNINGACQSATKISGNLFEVMATSETLKRTNFRYLETGEKVNLELPLTLKDPLGGHLVSGHIDDTGKILGFAAAGEGALMKIEFDSVYGQNLIEKGSIAIDGISLTCFDIQQSSFSVSLIPETLNNTNLQFRKSGDSVNLEFDQVGKYIEKMIKYAPGKISLEFLKENGF